MSRLNLGGIFIKCGLRAGVVIEHFREGLQVFEEVWVGEVAAFEIGEEGGEADGCCNRQEG